MRPHRRGPGWTGLDRRSLRLFDFVTLLALALLMGLGVVLVASAGADGDPGLAKRQLTWAGIGLLLATTAATIDYRHLSDHAYHVWAIAIAALLWVLVFEPPISGAHSWIHIGGFSLQPSEFAKVAAILVVARWFADRRPRPFGLGGLITPGLLVGVPFVLIAMQPDLGTAGTYLPILLGIAWVAGLRGRSVGALAAIGALLAPVAYFFLQDYQRTRLTSFLNPGADPLGAGYQITQSKIAVGAGGLTGKGLYSGTQSQLDFLPEQHNDFIMAVLGEELGFIGVALALLLYLFLLLRLAQAAHQARDRVGSYIAIGVATLLAFHLAINVSMVIGYAPITGIPLPLLSYGGSSALATSLAVGIALSVKNRRFMG